jgi:hypothetical protein
MIVLELHKRFLLLLQLTLTLKSQCPASCDVTFTRQPILMVFLVFTKCGPASLASDCGLTFEHRLLVALEGPFLLFSRDRALGSCCLGWRREVKVSWAISHRGLRQRVLRL